MNKTCAVLMLACVTACPTILAPSRAAAQTGPATSPATSGKVTVKETVVGKIDDGKSTRSIALSPDMKHVAVLTAVIEGEGEQAKTKAMKVTLDGKAGPEFEWIVPASVSFSGDSAKCGYVVQAKSQMFAVVDGKEQKAYYEILNNALFFSGKGDKFGYFVKSKAGDKAKMQVVVDAVESKEYDTAGGLAFSPDGKRYGYFAIKGDVQQFVIDGQESKEYPRVGAQSLSFSPDSKRVAFAAVRDEKVFVVLDGQEGAGYTEVSRPVFSPDSKHVVYAALKANKKWAIVEDGKETREYEKIVGDSLRYSPDSTKLSCVAGRKNKDGKDKMLLVSGDVESREYDAIIAAAFSPDSKRSAFAAVPDVSAAKAVQATVVIDGLEGQKYDRVLGLQFTPDNRRLAYVGVRNGKMVTVIDGSESPQYDLVQTLLFGEDGKRLAYVAVQAGKTLVVTERGEGKAYDAIVAESLVFSPDGKRLAYDTRTVPAGEASKQTGTIVVDSTELPETGPTVARSRIVWDSPTTLHALTVRKGDVIRVEATVE